MVIYIEDALLQNFIIDSLLISLTISALNLSHSPVREFLFSILESFFVVIIHILNLSYFLSIILKILLLGITLSICLPQFSAKRFSLCFSVFLSFTFLIGGFSIGLENIFSIKINGFYMCFLVLLFYIILLNIIKVFYKKRVLNKFSYNVKLIKNKTKFYVKTYLDSGNLFQDKETGFSVLVVNFETFSKIYNVNIVDFLMDRLNEKLEGRYIKISTVSGESKMFVTKIDKAITYEGNSQKEIHILVGVGHQLIKNDEYEGLLSPLAL